MLDKILNKEYLDPEKLAEKYSKASPFPHIVLDNFFKKEILDKVLEEFPDLSKVSREKRNKFKNQAEIKFASKGMDLLSPEAFKLISFLNSEFFLKYLQKLTGIKETLISDPYLSGAGYHEIKKGGVLKVHADFNKHGGLDLDRRINLLIYLNKDWDEKWGGDLQLFDQDMKSPIASAFPHFNKCVIFNTTSYTFHGHPDELKCPKDTSRKSIALYYFSTGRPKSEISESHNTLFKERKEEKFLQEDGAIKPLKNMKYFLKKILRK